MQLLRAAVWLLSLPTAVLAAPPGAPPRFDAPVFATIRPVPLTLTGEHFGAPGPGADLVFRFADGTRLVVASTSPRVLAWEDGRIVLDIGEDALSGAVRVRTPEGASPPARLDVFAYDWFDIPPTAGTNALPLALATGADGQVWVNQEFHLDFQHLDPTTGVVTGLPIPKPPGPGPFATTLFGDHRTQTSTLGESILVDPQGRVWFTQGGGSLYSGQYPNHSRVVAYDPAAPDGERYRVYNMPGDWNEVIGIAWDEARGRMWVAQGGLEAGPALASFDPERIPWDNDFDFSVSLIDQVCEVGEPEDDCYRLYRLPEESLHPAHLEVAENGLIWYTAYWGRRIGVLEPASGRHFGFPVPEAIGTAPPVWIVGAGPWEIVQAPGGDIIFNEFFDSTVSRFDASRLLDPACRRLDGDGRNPCMTDFVVPGADLTHEQVHSIAYDLEGRLWYTQHGDRDTLTEASLGYITADWQHIVRLPSLGLFPANDAPAANGIAVDPTTGDLYFAEFFRKRIGRLHLVVDGPAADAGAAASAASSPVALAVSAYPSPARGRVTVAVEVPEPGVVAVAVYDLLGRRVAVLHDGAAPAGPLTLALEGSAFPAGVYVVRAEGAGAVATARLVLTR
jgi:streptogramin lyase